MEMIPFIRYSDLPSLGVFPNDLSTKLWDSIQQLKRESHPPFKAIDSIVKQRFFFFKSHFSDSDIS